MVTKYSRLLLPPKDSFFLLGVRGVGKSTWVREHFKEAARNYDLLDETLYTELLANKSRFYEEIVGEARGAWVIVDEIQRLPSLLNECHRLIEERGIKFALLGSSARKLRSSGVNLLGGRAFSLELYPLTPEELGSDFRLDSYLQFGGIPLIAASPDPISRLRAYVQTYLREEIQQEALVRNLEGFARFLPVAGLFHGQILNVEGLARDVGIARTTVQGYLDILDDTLLAFRLRAFEGRLRVKEKKHPKLYWIDPALARAVKKQFGQPSPEELGPLFEGFIIQLVRTYHSLGNELYDEIYYWGVGKKESSVEVDLLLKRGSEFVAIEVKYSSNFHESWLKGLHAIAELKGVRRRILVYRGTRDFKTSSGIEVWSLMTFCESLSKGEI